MIIVMCAQNSFLNPQGSVYMGEKAEVLKVRLADYLSSYHGERVFFREKHGQEDTFFSNDKTHSIVNTFDYQVCESLRGFATLYFDKTRYSGLYETGFEDQLKRSHTRTAELVGLETHTSILFTAEELRNRGIEVTVIEPLTVARDDYMHSVAIALMANNLGVRISG